MRQIKFRGKMVDGGRWISGSLLVWPDGETYILYDRNFATSGTVRKESVRPETVGQYIERKDKKDNDIYDGDILYVEFSDGSNGYNLIGWNEEQSCWGVMNSYDYQSIAEGYDFAEFRGHVLNAYFKDAIICEVVGNIHDNPELLKTARSAT